MTYYLVNPVRIIASVLHLPLDGEHVELHKVLLHLKGLWGKVCGAQMIQQGFVICCTVVVSG